MVPCNQKFEKLWHRCILEGKYLEGNIRNKRFLEVLEPFDDGRDIVDGSDHDMERMVVSSRM